MGQEDTASNSRNNEKAGETKQKAPFLSSINLERLGKTINFKFFILNVKKCKEHNFQCIVNTGILKLNG